RMACRRGTRKAIRQLGVSGRLLYSVPIFAQPRTDQARTGRVMRLEPHRGVARPAAMNRFLEYTVNHPFLVSAAAILAVMALVIEIRLRQRGSNTVGTADAVRLTNAGALILDVRGEQDYQAGHIIDARHVPASEVAARAETFKRFKEKPVLVYCENGFSSA